MPVITAVTQFRIIIIIIVIIIILVVVIVAAAANLTRDRSSKIKLNKLLRNLSNIRTL